MFLAARAARRFSSSLLQLPFMPPSRPKRSKEEAREGIFIVETASLSLGSNWRGCVDAIHGRSFTFQNVGSPGLKNPSESTFRCFAPSRHSREVAPSGGCIPDGSEAESLLQSVEIIFSSINLINRTGKKVYYEHVGKANAYISPQELLLRMELA